MSGQFWMVWCESGDMPRVKHESEANAIREAERLARANPEQRFYVLEAIELRTVTNMARVNLRCEEMPF